MTIVDGASTLRRWGRLIGLVAGLGLAMGVVTIAEPTSVQAKPRKLKRHRVWKGQTLGKIAKRYNITVEALCTANGITKRHPIKPGQRLVIPPRSDGDGTETAARVEAERDKQSVTAKKTAKKPAEKKKKARQGAAKTKNGKVFWHEVRRRQNLGSIARRHHTSVEALVHANDINKKAPIQPGQWLIVPHPKDKDGAIARKAIDDGATPPSAHEDPAASAPKNASYKGYLKRPKRRRYVKLAGRMGRSWEGVAVTRKGRATKKAKAAFEEVLATRGGKHKPIDPRLIELVAKVSDAFGGRTIHVVSGVRLGDTSRGSRHRHGRAVDFTVEGVPNEVVRDFVKTFAKVGVGYYPNSHFVHMDVRKQWTYWVDVSSPGQRPRYAGFWTRRPRSK